MKNRGVLLFAFNNERIDYLRIARYCASRVRTYWNLPVAVVTDRPDAKGFDFVVPFSKTTRVSARRYEDYDESLSFYNLDRHRAISLSPFDETILIDTDYLPNSSLVPGLWTTQSLLLTDQAHSVGRHDVPVSLKKLSAVGPSMFWATIVMFNRLSPVAQRFFDEWSQVIKTYQHYSSVFQLSDGTVRNDFAVSVAIHKMFEGTVPSGIRLPYSIPTALPEEHVTSLTPLSLSTCGAVPYDVHVFNKKSLTEAVCGLKGF